MRCCWPRCTPPGDLRQAAGEAPGVTSARAPGLLAAHYSPNVRVELVDEDAAPDRLAELLLERRYGGAVGLLAPHSIPGVPDGVVVLEPAGPAEEYARLLYARLRQADRLGLDVLVCVPPPARGIGVAVVDRLRRAATPA